MTQYIGDHTFHNADGVRCNPELRKTAPDTLRRQLQAFVDCERSMRDNRTRGGQSVGTGPTINVSTLRRLEKMLDE